MVSVCLSIHLSVCIKKKLPLTWVCLQIHCLYSIYIKTQSLMSWLRREQLDGCLTFSKVSTSKLLAAIFWAHFSTFKVRQNPVLTFLDVILSFILYAVWELFPEENGVYLSCHINGIIKCLKVHLNTTKWLLLCAA